MMVFDYEFVCRARIGTKKSDQIEGTSKRELILYNS